MSEAPEHPASKQEQIIDAAIAEFRENGFAAASMDRVSARANVSKRTVYKHFESKQKLFQAIIAQLWARINADMNIQYVPGKDVRAQLTALAEANGRILTDPDIMSTSRLVMSEVLRSPELAEETQIKLSLQTVFVDILRAATREGQLTVEDADVAADEFLGLLKARAFWPVVLGAPLVTRDEMAKIISSTVDMMMSRYSPK